MRSFMFFAILTFLAKSMEQLEDPRTCMQRRFKRAKKKTSNTPAKEAWFRDQVWHHYEQYKDCQLKNASDALRVDGDLPKDEVFSRCKGFCTEVSQQVNLKPAQRVTLLPRPQQPPQLPQRPKPPQRPQRPQQPQPQSNLKKPVPKAKPRPQASPALRPQQAQQAQLAQQAQQSQQAAENLAWRPLPKKRPQPREDLPRKPLPKKRPRQRVEQGDNKIIR